jgi:hypothetical protein
MSGKHTRTPEKSDSNPGPGFVTRDFCNERTERVLEKLKVIEGKVDSLIAEKKEESHSLRNTILSVLSGAVVALVAWAISHVHF